MNAAFTPDAEIWQVCVHLRSYASRACLGGVWQTVTFFRRELDGLWYVTCNGYEECRVDGTLQEAEAAARKVLRRELFSLLRKLGGADPGQGGKER